MEIREWLVVLRRRAWIPALLVVVTVAATAVFVYLAKPQYQATATVIAQGSGSATVLNFQDIASSNNVALKVNEQLKLPETVGETANRITVTSGRTNLYRITATDADPRVAESIANTAAQVASDLYTRLAAGSQTPVSNDLQANIEAARAAYLTAAKNLLEFKAANPNWATTRDPNVAVQAMVLELEVQAASQSYLTMASAAASADVTQVTSTISYQATPVDSAVAVPDTTGRYLKLLYAAVFALVLGVALIFALEYMDNSIREPEEVEQLFGAPVIGIIPRVNSKTLRPSKGAA
jgi:capsular polysaccharide biosynthesis protein